MGFLKDLIRTAAPAVGFALGGPSGGAAGAAIAGQLFPPEGSLNPRQAGDLNASLQREFAQTGVQWRAEDARKAGIHPLAALGANLPSASPVYAGTDMASYGQDISRAMDASRSSRQRTSAVSKTVRDLGIQRMGLENELLAARIAQIRTAGHPPARPEASADTGPIAYPLPARAGNAPWSWEAGPSATAEQVERDYGDIAQNLYGMWRFGADALNRIDIGPAPAGRSRVRMVRPGRGY